MTPIQDPGIARLLGSSAPSGALPTFKPIARTASAASERAASAVSSPDQAILVQAAKIRQLLAEKTAVYARADALDARLPPKPIDGTEADLHAMPAEQMSSLPDQPARDPVFDAIAAHRAACDAWWDFGAGGADRPSEGPLYDAERRTLRALEEVQPQTVAGLKVWVDYLAEVAEQGDWSLAERALPRINDAVRDLVHATPLSPVGTGYDADLLALGAEFDRIMDLLPAAYIERYRLEAERDNNLPPVPEGLIADPDHRLGEDVELFTAAVPGDEIGRRYYTAKAIERIRTHPRVKYVFDRFLEEGNDYDEVMKRVADDEKQARAEAVVAAFGPWGEACRRHSAAIGYDAAAARHDELELRARATFDRIEMITPLTLAGLAVQARTMVTYSRGSVIKHAVVERLDEFAKASEPVADGCDDPFVALFRQAHALRDRVSDPDLSTEVSDAALSALQQVDDAVIEGAALPASAAGVVAALEWAITEYEAFQADDEGSRDRGAQLMLALLQGALNVARRQARSDVAAPDTVRRVA